LKNVRRGYAEVFLGGQTRTLRFRTHEIALLEERLGMGITKILTPETIGLRLLRESILVGVAHEFAGKRGKDARLTPVKVAKWIDDYGDFTELLNIVVETITMGLPGSETLLEEDDEGDEDVDPLSESDDESAPQEQTDRMIGVS
jgi:hypothetical protein